MLRTFGVLIVILLAVYIIGCGGDDSDSEERVLPAALVSADPPSGSQIAANGIITLTFNNPLSDVRVSAGVAAPSGKMVVVKGPFVPGPLNLTVTWANGIQTLTYTVTGPD